jgi:hypothetical protein
MGVFTERRFLRLAPQARMAAPGRKVYFVLTGDGRVGGQAYRHYTAVFCETCEDTAFEAETPTEILVFGLPKLDLRALRHRRGIVRASIDDQSRVLPAAPENRMRRRDVHGMGTAAAAALLARSAFAQQSHTSAAYPHAPDPTRFDRTRTPWRLAT